MDEKAHDGDFATSRGKFCCIAMPQLLHREVAKFGP
jgi:hypothetical protein